MDVIKLLSSFSNIVYIDDGHKYINKVTGEYYPSVTSLLESLKPKFDSKFWKVYKALEASGYTVKDTKQGAILVNDETIINPYFSTLEEFDLKVTPEDIDKQWKLESKIGKTRGTITHNILENMLKRKVINYDIPTFVSYLSTVEAIKFIKSIEVMKELAQDFTNTILSNYTVIAQEFVVGDEDYKIAGTFDLLLFNNKTEKFELWDFKTDKKIKSSSLNNFSYFNINASELNKYSLQLGIYKHLIYKNTGIFIEDCYIAHFDYKKYCYKIIETLDFNNEIESFFKDGKHKSTLI